MEPGMVTIKYNTTKWAQAYNGDGAKLDSQNYQAKIPEPRSLIPTKNSATQYYKRRKHVQVLSSSSLEKSTDESLKSMNEYAIKAKDGKINFKGLEQSWYADLVNVGQRLKLLRETFKVVQTVRKKKALGLKVDFKPLYDTRTPRAGSPSHLDEELTAKTEDDDDLRVKEYPPPTRRGRPRKKRGRERKPTIGRGDLRALVARTRLSRRHQDQSSLPPASTPQQPLSRANSPFPPSLSSPMNYSSRNDIIGSNENSPSEPPFASPHGMPLSSNQNHAPMSTQVESGSEENQGPPLMYSPPILPSQRLELVQGFPPYKHMKEIEAGVDLDSAAIHPTTKNSIMKAGFFHQTASTPQEPVLSDMPAILRVSSTETSQPSEREGPESAEISRVFMQLANEQAEIRSQPVASSPYVDTISSLQSGKSYSVYKKPLLTSQNTDLLMPESAIQVQPAEQIGQPIDYDMQRVELELAAALNLAPIEQEIDTKKNLPA